MFIKFNEQNRCKQIIESRGGFLSSSSRRVSAAAVAASIVLTAVDDRQVEQTNRVGEIMAQMPFCDEDPCDCRGKLIVRAAKQAVQLSPSSHQQTSASSRMTPKDRPSVKKKAPTRRGRRRADQVLLMTAAKRLLPLLLFCAATTAISSSQAPPKPSNQVPSYRTTTTTGGQIRPARATVSKFLKPAAQVDQHWSSSSSAAAAAAAQALVMAAPNQLQHPGE